MSKLDPILNVNMISRISEGTSIKGEIASPSDLRIDGTFEGKINSEGKVIIGEKAFVKGDVVCENMDIYGKLEGNVIVKGILSLKESSVVNGNLNINKLIVDLNSVFNGNCRMLGADETLSAANSPSDEE